MSSRFRAVSVQDYTLDAPAVGVSIRLRSPVGQKYEEVFWRERWGMHGLWAEDHTQTSLWRGRLASGRPVKPDARRENRRANWNSTQPLANMGGSCRSERIRAESKWEISVNTNRESAKERNRERKTSGILRKTTGSILDRSYTQLAGANPLEGYCVVCSRCAYSRQNRRYPTPIRLWGEK